MNKTLVTTIMAAALSFGVAADEINKSNISKKLQTITPFAVQSVTDSVVDGLYEVVTGKGIFYTTKDGEYLFSGSIHEFKPGLRNITSERKAEIASVDIDKLRSSFVTYKAPNEKHEVLVFFDTTCGYCRKMHNEMSQYNAAGITVHYAMYPRNGISKSSANGETFTPTYNSMMNVVCSNNPTSTMDMVMRGTDVAPQACDNSIKEHYELGSALGVRGTPAVYAMDGKSVMGGYAQRQALLKKLNEIKG
ncbi:DsbC family protein [Colwellia sp. MSW7]|uniref:Thiol:disulfide interchange protein n=1 Tax=Colwellia maritima TaxID=2912588 RepID=A0ABS9X6N6_9GAMM|nr:DsbC family protein [Colwellia maritima]MCI2285905.1 DsbC family protein [Colwellia maritima]